MKNIVEIETAQELVDLASPVRQEGDARPVIKQSEYVLVIDNDEPRIEGKNREFQLGRDVTAEDIFIAMAKACSIKLHLT